MSDTAEWTTGRLRQEAEACEKRGEWGRAIDVWQAAMDNYPGRDRPLGALAKREIAEMERRQQACLAMYFPA